MAKRDSNNPALYLSLIVVLLFIAGRLWGYAFFDNNWSFVHWKYLSGWYIVLWFLLLISAVLSFTLWGERIALFFDSRPRVIVPSAVIMGILVLFQFNSFLYGGGNLRIAQVAQTDHVIYRWFEYGSILIVSLFDWLFGFFKIHYNTAGVYAWKVISFGGTLLSLIGALKLAKELTADSARRFYLFLILFFGPQAVLYFGYVGVEPVVVAVTIWFTLLAVRLTTRFTSGRLFALWGIFLVGVFMHFTLAYLLPAAVYATVWSCKKRDKGRIFALAAALSSYVGLLALTYYWAGQNLEFSRFILLLSGKLPHSDYGIFSTRHIGDVLQILFLAFPQVIVAAYLFVDRRRLSNDEGGLPLLMGLCGITVVLVLDPVNSVVLDFPRLTAYLFPLSFILAVLLKDQPTQPHAGRDRLVALLAVACLTIPISYLPNYVRIAKADPYVTEYLDKHESFYLNGCLAFRDAYFYRKELDKANGWEWKLPTKSPDYLNLEGVKSLSLQGEEAEALRTLYKVIVQNPYLSEARALFASIQMKLGRYNLAKPQIDTSLMLEPYRRDYLVNLYRYYRDVKSYPRALKNIKKTLQLFPEDNVIKTDLMVVTYRSGAFRAADSLANVLLAADSTLPYPYVIKGFLAERQEDSLGAISFYKKFLAIAPDVSDTLAIKERLAKLQPELKEK